jgi:hypothetical protein
MPTGRLPQADGNENEAEYHTFFRCLSELKQTHRRWCAIEDFMT